MIRQILVVALLCLAGRVTAGSNPNQDANGVVSPGSIDFTRTTFAVGDTVWVFNAADSTLVDRNGFIFPHAWNRALPAFGVIIQACHRLGEESTYRFSMYWNNIEVDCAFAIPEQRAVGFKLPCH